MELELRKCWIVGDIEWEDGCAKIIIARNKNAAVKKAKRILQNRRNAYFKYGLHALKTLYSSIHYKDFSWEEFKNYIKAHPTYQFSMVGTCRRYWAVENGIYIKGPEGQVERVYLKPTQKQAAMELEFSELMEVARKS